MHQISATKKFQEQARLIACFQLLPNNLHQHQGTQKKMRSLRVTHDNEKLSTTHPKSPIGILLQHKRMNERERANDIVSISEIKLAAFALN